MRITKALLLLIMAPGFILAQTDTLVIRDYAQILISIDSDGGIQPVTDFSNLKESGLFINTRPEGDLRICNDSEMFIWVNGRMLRSINGCDIFKPQELYKNTSSDTIYLSFNAPNGFENFACELVIYENQKILREEVSKARDTQDIFRDFTIISILFLLACFGAYATAFSNRLNYLISRTFSLKMTSYQFTNTNFFSRENIFMVLIFCMTISFEIIYINQKVGEIIFQSPTSVLGFFGVWSIVTFWFLLFYLSKRILIQIVSGMFQLRRLRDWQLFDLVNFAGYFTLILFIVILWDFILKESPNTWIRPYFLYYFVIVLGLFELWFVIKFVINSSYQKLLIISYLCATEIIPAILILGWFLK